MVSIYTKMYGSSAPQSTIDYEPKLELANAKIFIELLVHWFGSLISYQQTNFGLGPCVCPFWPQKIKIVKV